MTLSRAPLDGRQFLSRGLRAALLVAAASSSLGAQTLWSVEGTSPSYGEFNSPPPLCPTASPPYDIHFPPTAACPTNSAFLAGSCALGGTAFDNDGIAASGGIANPVIIQSDGIEVEFTDTTSAYVTSCTVGTSLLPGFVTGLACHSATDTVYATDGNEVIGFTPPPGPPGCGAPTVVFGPITLPPGVRLCGLGFDPCSLTFWGCDSTGFVFNFDLTGTILSGFFANNWVGNNLVGLTVNATNGNVIVTNGVAVAEFLPTGVIAPSGPFYLDQNPYPVPLWAGPISGLGFSLRPQNYGVGCGSTPPPTVTYSGGYPWAGNPLFTLGQTNATPGSLAFLLVSFDYNCPAIPWGCGGFWVSLPFYTVLSVGAVPASGTMSVPVPLPPGLCGPPVGIPVFIQFANFTPAPELSDALAFTIGGI